MITLQQARQLKPGDYVYHAINKNKKGFKQKWKVNGKVKTWVYNPLRIKIPVKHGLYTFDYITEHDLKFIDLK